MVRHRSVLALALAVALLAPVLLSSAAFMAPVLGAFATQTTNAGNAFEAGELDSLVPVSVSASRSTATTCEVSWSSAGNVPTGMTYEVSDGSGIVATGIEETAATITVPVGAVTPAVSVRYNQWVSTGSTSAAAPCTGYPGIPTIATTSATGTITATWTAPESNGSAITGYTASISPGSTTCTVTVPAARTCTFDGLTDGLTYTITVASANANGTSTTSRYATSYPSDIMSSSNLRLWFDAQTPSTLSAANNCSGSNAAPGTSIGCWKNRAAQSLGNAARGGSTSTNAGVLTASAINGHPAIRLDRTRPQFYVVNNAALGAMGAAPRTLFAVVNARTVISDASDTNNASIVAGWEGYASGILAESHVSTSNAVSAFNGDFWTSTNQGAYPTSSGTGIAIAEAVFTQDGTALGGGIGRDGRPLTTGSLTGSPYTPTNKFFMGAVHTNLGGWMPLALDGDLGEILAFDRALTAGERRVVMEYLAQRWEQVITPSAPAVASATPHSGQVTLTWTAPEDWGSAITGYQVTASPGGATCTTATTSCTVTGLSNGTSYTFTVSASNGVGTGPSSPATPAVTPRTMPGEPGEVSAVPGDAQATASWTAPASDGGGPITEYTASFAAPGQPTRVCTTTGATSCAASGLVNGVTYTVTVTATNAGGPGPSSGTAAVLPYPSGLMNAADLELWLDGADAATMLTAAGCTGAAAAAGDRIACWQDKSANANHLTQGGTTERPVATTSGGRLLPVFDGDPGDGLTRTAGSVTGVPTGTSASTALVVATNTASSFAAAAQPLGWGSGGTGGRRDLWLRSGTGAVGLDAGGGAGQIASQTWTDGTTIIADAQFLSGGTGFDLVTNGTPAVASAGSFSTGDAALRVGSAWTGSVQEVIVLSSSLTPAQRRTLHEYLARKWTAPITPSAPVSVTAVAGVGQVTVNWVAPWNGGSAISGYSVTASPGGATCTTTSRSCTVTGLAAGTPYTFTVRATNDVGTGPADASSGATPG